MLGIATTIFWIIIGAFIASAAYSIKDINFDFGDPQFGSTANNELRLSMPFFIDNRGFYSLKAFNLTTVFADSEGSEISRDSTFVSVLARGQNTAVLHNITLSFDRLGEQYLFNDSRFAVAAVVGLNFAELLPTQLSANFSYPWGAPFYDFALGQPQQSRLNATHARLRVPLSFDNHAAFDLMGAIRMGVFNNASSMLGESEIIFAASKGSRFADAMEFSVPLTAVSSLAQESGYFEVYFSTSMFEYGPLVIPYG